MKDLNVPKYSSPCCLQLPAQRAIGIATVLKSAKAVPNSLALNYPLKYFSAVAGSMTLRGAP